MFQMKQNVSVLLEIQRYSDQGDQSRYSLTGKNANDGKERGYGKPLFCQDQIDKYGGENPGQLFQKLTKRGNPCFFAGIVPGGETGMNGSQRNTESQHLQQGDTAGLF